MSDMPGPIERAASPEAMRERGAEWAQHACAGDVFGLVGGLGAGKTHWSQGFVAGMGSVAPVTSPTFGLIHEYVDGRLPIFHCDLYRLDHPEELLALGWDELLDSASVVIVEWADRFPSLMPTSTIWLEFQILADGVRQIRRVGA